MPSALLLTGDLMFVTKFNAAAQRAGVTAEVAMSLDDLWTKAAGDVSLVAIDLTMRRLDIAAVVARLRELPAPPKTLLAFGPHVQTEALDAARVAGCDLVLPRSQFDGHLDDLLRRYVV